jgi:UDP-glucose 4-epimerase
MKKKNKVVYESTDGDDYDTEEEAIIADYVHILDRLDVDWREPNLNQIAKQLHVAGYTIVKKPELVGSAV